METGQRHPANTTGKEHQTLVANDICPLCDREPETSYHATVTCARAQDLRHAMREHWPLPDEEQFRYTGPDWLLLLLDGCSEEVRDLVKLLLWKTWSVHNNITHQAGSTSIPEEVFSLISMQSTLTDISISNGKCSAKGKCPSVVSGKAKSSKSGSKPLGRTAWEPPPQAGSK